MDGRGRGKPRSFDEDSSKESRKKEDKKKPGDKPTQAKVKSKQVTDMEDQLNGHAHQNNRYHQREVPPRFQLQKQAKNTQKYIIKANQAVTKKPSKDATRWTSDPHTHTPSQDHTHSTPTHTPAGDGGWSTGLPAKGSGWRKAASESTGLNEWGQDKKSPHDEVVSGWEGDVKEKSEDSWGHNGHSEGGWTSDQDEGSSRSQSPGGIVMVVKQTTPSKENASGGWESKQVGTNWKMHTLDTKPADEKHSSEEGSVSNWTNQELGERELTNQRTSLSDSTNESLSNKQDSSPTKPLSQNSLSGSITPTQELSGVWRSGRTSANSISSLTEVNGVKSKGGSRSASPRKMMTTRYDPVSSNPNSLSRGAGLILPRPRKSIAELEGGLESLHSAPSGWGMLPSPKGDKNDKGTEFWGIPPDDLVKMTGGTEQPPVINGWGGGGSRSPNPKASTGEYADSAGWTSNESAGKSGWGDEKVPSTDSGSYYESGPMTPSGSQPHLYTPHGGPLDTPTTDYPHKQPKWNSLDDQKDSSFQPAYNGQQMMQNQLIVKDLVLRCQQLAKLQLGQMSSGNIQSLQKSLSQQLNQAKAVRQKLLSQAPPTVVPANHPLKVQLSQTNDIILQLEQLLNQSQQMLSQQNPYTARVKPEIRQHTRYTESGTEISYGMRDMALNQQRPQGIHASRSMSKLHRLISNQEDMTESSYGTNSPAYTSSTPFSPSFRSSSATTMASSSLTAKPVHQIQEFKPGVPWQPRKSEPTVAKPMELYNPGAPQRSMSTSIYGQQGRYGGGQRFTRSMSTDNNYYGGNQAPPTPTQGDHPWSGGTETRAQNFPGRNWRSRPGRISLPSTPVGTLPDHGGWRQPPSTLLPNQYKQFESSRSRRVSRGTPIDAHPEWFPDTPTSADPVWGSGVGRSEQGTWPQQSKSGHGWSQGEPLKESFPNTPSGEGRWSESVFSDWQSDKRSSTTASLSPWLVIRTNSPQLNIQSLKDTCKGFGDVKSFIEGSDFVLVGYSSVAEAVQTKSHIESLWGGQATAEVVPEGELENLWQQNDVPKANPPSSLHPSLLLMERGQQQSGVFKWEDPNKALSYNRQASTPGGSSVWSDGGFLSGISSPWSSDFSGTLTSPSTGYQSDDLPSVTATPEERVTTQGSSLSTYLPNGLL